MVVMFPAMIRLFAAVALVLFPVSARAASTPAPLGTGEPSRRAMRGRPRSGSRSSGPAGNAVDAAVATALALAVVYPEAGNLGGGGFALVRRGDKLTALDFRETAPAAARRDMYLDAKGNPVEDASEVGPLAAGVPGSPAGLYELHRKLRPAPLEASRGAGPQARCGRFPGGPPPQRAPRQGDEPQAPGALRRGREGLAPRGGKPLAGRQRRPAARAGGHPGRYAEQRPRGHHHRAGRRRHREPPRAATAECSPPPTSPPTSPPGASR